MASKLGLSVHTINERLRDTRRKLSVSSSKATARILREVERTTPQKLGDKSSGDARPMTNGQASNPPSTRSLRTSRAAWTIGGLAMIAALFATLALSPTQPVATPAQAASAPVPVAESDASRAARHWLTLVDARNWQAAQPRS